MVNILIIAVLVLPWLLIPNNSFPDPTRIIKSAAFDFAMLGIIICAVTNGLKFEYRNKYLAWLSVLIFFGFGFNWYYPLIVGYGFNAGTIEANIHFVLSLFATICICSTFERSDFVRVAKAIVLSAILVASFAFLQVIGLDPMKNVAKYTSQEKRHICAFLDHPDVLANYLALSVPFFLYLFRLRYILPLIIIAIVLFFAHSTLSILAALISILVFFIFKYRDSKKWKIGFLLFSILLVALCFHPKFNKLKGGFTGRVYAWEQMLERANNPIFGQGLGIVKSYNVQFGTIKGGMNHWTFAHNDYIEMYCSGGVLLLFLFGLLVIDGLRKFNYGKDNNLGFAYLASFIVFLILMFGSFPMEIAPLALGGLIAWWGIQKT